MRSKLSIFGIASLLLALSSACYGTPGGGKPQGAAVNLFELSTDALVKWRTLPEPATMVVLSNVPFLQPIPKQLREKVQSLVKNGRAEDFEKKARYFRPGPILLPSQAISAALQCGLVSDVLWVIPSRIPIADFDLNRLGDRLVESGILTAEERELLTKRKHMILSPLRGHQLMMTTIMDLSLTEKFHENLIVHFDLSYFQALYKNEVKTPIYDLLESTLKQLVKALPKPSMTTLSYSTEEEGMVEMNLRFLGKDIQASFNAEGLSAARRRLRETRKKALYLATFMINDKALDLLKKTVLDFPDDPALLYDLYRFERSAKEGDTALKTLAMAVELDPGFGYEYLSLARDAETARRPDKAIEMLQKAKLIFPDNHYIDLETAAAWKRAGHAAGALAIYRDLQTKTWSEVYYPDMPTRLKNLISQVSETPRKPPGERNPPTKGLSK
ncbi:tetratricopeptide repeat protein [Geothermobacter hydrogeniphilus]|uniref:tetratricopeptide repeat protein n=1 Tax=Geothermobacter hydrogeniphilus TaxID=1969733 RepID=UPI0011AF6150|nr:hypothetical protein [Geothermobacter hydrogeniphilus]